MSGPARLSIEITSTAATANAALGQTDDAARDAARGVDALGAAFDQAEGKARQFGQSAEAVDEVGGASQKTAGALGDLGGALELVGASGASESLGTIGIVMQAAAGAADLYTVAVKVMTIENIRNVATMVSQKVALVATTVAQYAVIAATTAWTAAQWLLNIALNANPIGLIVLAIIILIAIIILVVTHLDFFKAAGISTWNAVRDAAVAAWRWIEQFVINPFMAGIRLLIDYWQFLGRAAQAAWDLITNAVANSPLIRLLQNTIDKIKQLVDMFTSVKVPSWVTNLNPFGRAALDAADVGGTVRAFRLVSSMGRRSIAGPDQLTDTAAITTAIRAAASENLIVVNVILDGKRVGGYVDRIVTSRLSDEGTRMLAGSWGPQ